MIHTKISMPPLEEVAAALRKTTEVLADEVACPTNQAPLWSEFEWCIAEAAAALQGISALLANGVRWQGPARWEAFVLEQKRQTQLRREHIAELLARIDALARQVGIAIVALKGSALYRLGVYQVGERPMGDIDLLVQDDALEATSRLLKSLGYAPGLSNRRHVTFEPVIGTKPGGFGEHVDNPVSIEVHVRIVEPLPIFEVNITALEFPQQPHCGLNPYPSVASLMRHLLLHAAGNIRARALRFVQLHDIALLAGRMNGADWSELVNKDVSDRGLWWAFAPLMLTARYYPAVIPRSVLDTSSRTSPWLLRRHCKYHGLTDVSWSNVRIQAFPGIEWSSSIAEALRFIASRAWPSRRALAELKLGTQKLAYAAAIPWYGQSHLTRIARWIFSQPPRVQTIHSVRSALGNRRAD